MGSEKRPLSLRLQLWLGRQLYDFKWTVSSPHRVPFGRLVKINCHPTEAEAIEFVRANTTIPVPKVYGSYTSNANREGTSDLVLEYVKGEPLSAVWRKLTVEDKCNIVLELAGYVRQLRDIAVPEGCQIGSTHQGSGLDHRLGGDRWGPFPNVEQFHDWLRRKVPLKDWPDGQTRAIHGKPSDYGLKYTHADLHHGNIIVRREYLNGGMRWTIVSIIDWEFAGWYPEYWEYVKLHFLPDESLSDFYLLLDQAVTTYYTELASDQMIQYRFPPMWYDDGPLSKD